MLDVVADSLATRGYIVLPDYGAGISTHDVASRLGSVVTISGATDVQVLTPRERSAAPPNIYSGNYGVDAFPLHTDMAHWFLPPRYMMLRCIIGSASVPTRIFDGNQLISAIGRNTLTRTLVQPRRAIRGKRPLLRILDRYDGHTTMLRWDRLFIRPATRASVDGCAAIDLFLRDCLPDEITLERAGDTLVIDNWRVFHGRAPVPASAKDRRIERCYLGTLVRAA